MGGVEIATTLFGDGDKVSQWKGVMGNGRRNEAGVYFHFGKYFRCGYSISSADESISSKYSKLQTRPYRPLPQGARRLTLIIEYSDFEFAEGPSPKDKDFDIRI